MKTIYVVIDNLVSKEDAWETHLTSILHGYIDACNLDTEYSIIQLTDASLIKQYFETKIIKPSDKFVFPNAWTSMTTYVKHWSEIYQIPVEMIGFWTQGCYINGDSEFRPLNNRDWRKVFERASFRCLDKSFFISEYMKEQFRIYISKLVFPERLHVMPFPLDYLSMELSQYRDSYFKKDLIVFPWHKFSTIHEQIMYDWIRVFKDYQIVFAQERLPLERHQLLNQLAKAKIAFLPYNAPNIGKEIYECMLLETIPLVPNIEGLEDLVPEEFRYPVEWTDTIFNYCKFAPDITSKVRDLMENFGKYKPILKAHQEYLNEKYFDSEAVIKELFV